jgi:hypothetical protein
MGGGGGQLIRSEPRVERRGRSKLGEKWREGGNGHCGQKALINLKNGEMNKKVGEREEWVWFRRKIRGNGQWLKCGNKWTEWNNGRFESWI